MHKDSLEDRVHHIFYFILVFLKLQREKSHIKGGAVDAHYINIYKYGTTLYLNNPNSD